ncbi:hypothetical protein ACFQ3R_06305 [Mesonia ostreae]|uniref:Uncharacterized protein n=1 Tax=Mesonia ostreae TaxID=861110 RepID=A0ABU2KH59_9FLAO|nr:hypothetical protein [Mesonia ostreae]MDT0294047.1 hypothetical protein [Mesonia ostreae]
MLSKKNKTLIIYDSFQYFAPFFRGKGYPTYKTLRDIDTLQKVARKISLKLGVFKNYWFDDWRKNLTEIDTVIIFASQHPSPVKFINETNPNIRIIYWYWNPVEKCVHPNTIPDKLCEKWSFDREDCLNYSMEHNTTFYFDTIEIPESEILFDLFFVGVNKGRKAALDKIGDKMEERGLKPHFYIVDDNWNSRNYRGDYPPINYPDYLKLVGQSKAILDYVQEGQNGLTLRPMESIFFKKKLVTNDETVKQEDFYNPSNVFILGVDDLNNLKEFLNSPYVSLDASITRRYDVDYWIERFNENYNK